MGHQDALSYSEASGPGHLAQSFQSWLLLREAWCVDMYSFHGCHVALLDKILICEVKCSFQSLARQSRLRRGRQEGLQEGRQRENPPLSSQRKTLGKAALASQFVDHRRSRVSFSLISFSLLPSTDTGPACLSPGPTEATA